MDARETQNAAAREVFARVIAQMDDAFARGDAAAFADLFVEGGYWRDILSFTWARRTYGGKGEIAAAFAAHAPGAGALRFRIAADRTPPRRVKRAGRDVIEGWFTFETALGRGAGFARMLAEAEEGAPRLWLALTTLHELRDHEEKAGAARPMGDEFSQIQGPENWADMRRREQAYADRDPQVVIIGAGQGGVMLAARLRQMGVDALVIEKNARVGDNWRARYNNLTLHNGVDANHFPYLPFPETWPVWLPKDKVADWLESYANFLELNVWTNSEVESAAYDAAAKRWRLFVRHGDERREMRVPHLVAAMGLSGGAPHTPDLPGLKDFAGAVMHSGAFQSGAAWKGKRAIVVGTGNSGHDIAQDLYFSGADAVSLMQRGPTCVISLTPGAAISYSVFSEGAPVDDADLMIAAVPYPMLIDSYQWITKRTNRQDADLLAGLNAAGFKTWTGVDDTGFQLLYLRGLGGYYIDVGCSQLIIERKVGVVQAEDMDRFEPQGLRLKDGGFVACDLVVLATGFESMQHEIGRIVGPEIAERIGPVWGFDEHYNMRNMWGPTAQENFWIMGGSLTEARFHSRHLALQVCASLAGVAPR